MKYDLLDLLLTLFSYFLVLLFFRLVVSSYSEKSKPICNRRKYENMKIRNTIRLGLAFQCDLRLCISVTFKSITIEVIIQ